ncbi:MAG: hypothetical protein AAF799_45770 [Myxococcota bacterium]
MLRKTARLCFLLTLTAAACEKPPAGEPTEVPGEANTEPAAAGEEAPEATADAPAADLPEATEVLAQAVEAIGGKEAVDKITSSYMESKTSIKAQNLDYKTKIWSKGDNFYVEIVMPGVGTSQVWKKGEEIWSKDPINGMRKLEGKEADQTRWGADPLLAANWQKYFDEAKTLEVRDLGDKQVYAVQLSKGETELVLLFDVEGYLPAGQSFTQETPMGSLPVTVTLEDYRKVEGVMTSFKSVTSMQIMNIEQSIEKYDVNVEIDDAKFDHPEA